MKPFERVKFQRPETGEICEALLSWDAGEFKLLLTWTETGGVLGNLNVEVARKDQDGIFRKVTDYTLDEEAAGVLRTLREMNALVNEIENSKNPNPPGKA